MKRFVVMIILDDLAHDEKIDACDPVDHDRERAHELGDLDVARVDVEPQVVGQLLQRRADRLHDLRHAHQPHELAW